MDERLRTLRDGQMIDERGVVDVPEETTGVVAGVVDVAGHNERLEQRRRAAGVHAEAESRSRADEAVRAEARARHV